MKNKIMTVLALMALVLCAACDDDKGNYDYHRLNEPEITGMPESLSVLIHDRFDLDPSMGSNIDDIDAYSYEWKAINNSGDMDEIVLGNVKHLDSEVTLDAGKYTLYFTATDKKTGLFWRESLELTVSDPSSEGWLVLCDVDSKTRLDVISAVTGQTYLDILKNNGMDNLSRPYSIQYQPNCGYSDSPFYLFTADGATRLSKNNFAWQKDYAFRYEVAKQANLKPRGMVCELNGFSRVLVSGGKAYYAQNMGIQGLFGSPANKGFDVAPYVGVNVGAMSYVSIYLLYDVTNKRFVTYSPLITALGFSGTVFSMDDMEQVAVNMKGSDMVTGTAFDAYPTGLDFVYMENTKYDPGNAKMGVTYTLLRDGDKTKLYGIQLGDLLTFMDCTFALGKAYYGDLSGCKDISRASCFAFSSLRNYMYYAVGGTVYRVDLSEQPLSASKQFTLSGENITMMKFNLYQNSASVHDYDLLVASERDGNGTLRIYDGMAAEGDFSKVSPTVHKGFAKIVDVTYRERTN